MIPRKGVKKGSFTPAAGEKGGNLSDVIWRGETSAEKKKDYGPTPASEKGSGKEGKRRELAVSFRDSQGKGNFLSGGGSWGGEGECTTLAGGAGKEKTCCFKGGCSCSDL